MLLNQTVENHGPVIGEHFFDRLIEIIRIVAHDTLAPERFGQFHEIGQGL